MNASPSSAADTNDGISLNKILHQKITTFPAAIQPIQPADSLESFSAYSSIASQQQIPSIARPTTLTPQEMAIHDAEIRGHPRIIHNRPPLRFDRAFFDDPSNRLKIIQMVIS